MKTLAQMTAEIREINVAKGWRPATGGPGHNTFGDYVALLHSEISEALEAYRDHRLNDATAPGPLLATHIGPNGESFDEFAPSKPEGVGSEFADVLIRLLDMCDIFGIALFDMDMEIGDVSPLEIPAGPKTFGDFTAWLHFRVSMVFGVGWEGITRERALTMTLRALVATAERFGVDLAAEYERKIAFNRTRTFQHGGRTLADNH